MMDVKTAVEIWSENQKIGAYLPCPRCGKFKMKAELHTNALSRRANIYVCDDCGTDEAIKDLMKTPDTTYNWFVTKFFADEQMNYSYDEERNRYTIKATTTVQVTGQDIDDIMVAAMEGGINYWCNYAYVDGDTYLGEYASEEISRGGKLILHDAEDDAEYVLTLEKLLKGIRIAIEEDFYSEYLWASEGKIDCCRIDAAVADVIVQLAIFGEVVYG